MKPRRSKRPFQRSAAMLVSVIVLLVAVAVLTACFLQTRVAQISVETAAVQRLRAAAAALGGAQVTLWQIQNTPDALAGLARVVAANDVSFSGAPLLEARGELAGANFEIAAWPGADALRLRARGVCGAAQEERWLQIPLLVPKK